MTTCSADLPRREMPRVYNRKRELYPVGAEYVGRGTAYGNPFVSGIHGTRDEVCDRFEREVLPGLDVRPLLGKDLVCSCAPKRCHADSLLRAARDLEISDLLG